jgi:hypothetical protein
VSSVHSNRYRKIDVIDDVTIELATKIDVIDDVTIELAKKIDIIDDVTIELVTSNKQSKIAVTFEL